MVTRGDIFSSTTTGPTMSTALDSLPPAANKHVETTSSPRSAPSLTQAVSRWAQPPAGWKGTGHGRTSGEVGGEVGARVCGASIGPSVEDREEAPVPFDQVPKVVGSGGLRVEEAPAGRQIHGAGAREGCREGRAFGAYVSTGLSHVLLSVAACFIPETLKLSCLPVILEDHRTPERPAGCLRYGYCVWSDVVSNLLEIPHAWRVNV